MRADIWVTHSLRLLTPFVGCAGIILPLFHAALRSSWEEKKVKRSSAKVDHCCNPREKFKRLEIVKVEACLCWFDFWLVNEKMSWHALVSTLTLTMSSSLSAPTAVLNMDNAVVDLETLHALYENVSITMPWRYLEMGSCVFMVTTLTNIFSTLPIFGLWREDYQGSCGQRLQ